MFSFVSGYITVLKYLFRKKVTIHFPKERNKRSDIFRGKHVLNTKLCVKCKTCEKACINGCINVENKFQIDYSSCCFCGRCVHACPTHALQMSKHDARCALNKKMLIQYLDGGK